MSLTEIALTVRCWLICSLLVGSCVNLYAQQKLRGVSLIARSTGESIKLRWAPSDPILWLLGNKHGYVLERVTMTEKNRLVNRQKIKLNANPFRPAEQHLWEQYIERDDYCAIAAQALFGETFDLDQQDQASVVKIVQKANELDSRFSFALFSADHSVRAAELSGLYFEDGKAAPLTKYLYRVYINLPEGTALQSDTGIAYVGLQDHYALPIISDLRSQFEDRRVTLSWNISRVEKIYTSFWVERSRDGRSFTSVTDDPIINTFKNEQRRNSVMYKVDSLPVNEVKYYYRVKGVNAFGEIGPASDTTSGFGRPSFAYSASIREHEISENGSAQLTWTFPTEGESLLSNFTLARVDSKSKQIHTVFSNIPKSSRVVIDPMPRSTNYYVVVAIDRFGRKNNSFPYLVQLEDSIAPLPPDSLQGRIDSLGHVHLKWAPNIETDLLGYGVYRSNSPAEEFIQVPTPILDDSRYVDTISLKNLSKRVYYKITAIDKRFNVSNLSTVLVLKKPDRSRPVSPTFKTIKNDSLGISISWVPSGSDDVVSHEVYRRSQTDSLWTLMKSYLITDTTSWVDADVHHNTNYEYTIIAIDDSELESLPASPVTLIRKSSHVFPPVEKIFSVVDESAKTVKLEWTYDEVGVKEFLVFKSRNGKTSLFKVIPGDRKSIVDDLPMRDLQVEYRLIARFSNGEKSPISKAVVAKQ